MRLPFFPLGMSIFPGEKIPLRIFEPRYKQLISESRKEGKTFGIPFVHESRVQDIGTEVNLTKVLNVKSDGEMIIVIEGLKIFRILHLDHTIPGKLYGGGEIEYILLEHSVSNRKLIQLINSLGLKTQEGVRIAGRTESYRLIDIAKSLNLDSPDKHTFLQLDTPEQRELFLVRHLEYLKMLHDQETMLKNNFMLN